MHAHHATHAADVACGRKWWLVIAGVCKARWCQAAASVTATLRPVLSLVLPFCLPALFSKRAVHCASKHTQRAEVMLRLDKHANVCVHFGLEPHACAEHWHCHLASAPPQRGTRAPTRACTRTPPHRLRILVVHRACAGASASPTVASRQWALWGGSSSSIGMQLGPTAAPLRLVMPTCLGTCPGEGRASRLLHQMLLPTVCVTG